MTSVLGIDAAWTAGEPSGVALIHAGSDRRWECVALAPSYDSFIGIADGNPVRWDQPPKAGCPEPKRLLTAAERLLGGERVTVVSVDMPMSHERIAGRREADRAISRKFGRMGCSTHSPSVTRPGAISECLLESLDVLGYRLAVSEPDASTVVEVYPHPALLCLLDRDYRVPYKVGKSRKYWPGLSLGERADRLVVEFRSIYEGLTDVIHAIPEFLPALPHEGALTSLKRHEDALDALVCAWVGARYFEGRSVPFGDDRAAIWVPSKGS